VKILVINCGSSSIKYQLFAMPDGETLASGLVERIGESQASHRHVNRGESLQHSTGLQIADHRAGLTRIVNTLHSTGAITELSELAAIGHRVVHGGELFRQPVPIDETVLAQIRALIPLAPLHNPAGLAGIEISRETAPAVPQIAVFDTAFHHTIPAFAYHYALPRQLYSEYRVRR